MKSRIITPKVGFENDKGIVEERICFPMRVITVAEENAWLARYADIADTLTEEQKASQQFDILVDGLAAWCVELPFTRNGDGKDVPLKADNPANAVRDYFKDRTGEQERVANQAILYYRTKLTPSVVF